MRINTRSSMAGGICPGSYWGQHKGTEICKPCIHIVGWKTSVLLFNLTELCLIGELDNNSEQAADQQWHSPHSSMCKQPGENQSFVGNHFWTKNQFMHRSSVELLVWSAGIIQDTTQPWHQLACGAQWIVILERQCPVSLYTSPRHQSAHSCWAVYKQ